MKIPVVGARQLTIILWSTIQGTSSTVPTEEADKSEKKKAVLGRIFESDGDIMEEHERKKAEKSALEILQDLARKKELKAVDHSQIEYLPIRKKLYIVPRALHVLPEKEVAARRDKMEIKVRGKGK